METSDWTKELTSEELREVTREARRQWLKDYAGGEVEAPKAWTAK